MELTITKNSSISFKEKCFNFIAGKLFSKKIKRVIYISSIFGILSQVKNPDKVLVVKLNAILNIAKNPESMMYPMQIQSLIWGGGASKAVITLNGVNYLISDLINQSQTINEYKQIAEYFAENAPGWLNYGSKAAMMIDVMLMIEDVINDKDNLMV